MWDVIVFLAIIPFAILGISIIGFAGLCTWIVLDAVYSTPSIDEEEI